MFVFAKRVHRSYPSVTAITAESKQLQEAQVCVCLCASVCVRLCASVCAPFFELPQLRKHTHACLHSFACTHNTHTYIISLFLSPHTGTV